MSMDPLADFDREIVAFLQTAGVAPDIVQLMNPPQRELGERASNAALRLARERRQSPATIAQEIAGTFDRMRYRFIAAVEATGGFVNFRLDYAAFVPHAIDSVRSAGARFGRPEATSPRRVVVEHTSVNPNKEWHVGHTRNAVLGDVVGRLLRHVGDQVQVQNYIDDTGVQAAMSVLALQDFPEADITGEKYDHYAGRGYVKLNAEVAAERELRAHLSELERAEMEEPSAGIDLEVSGTRSRLENIRRLQARILQVMHGLEAGEYAAVVRLILDAQLQTAFRLGIYYDLLNWESHLVQSHTLQHALELLSASPHVYTPDEGRYAGALIIETGERTSDGELKAEVIVRSNGLPTYVGKDIAYHMWKFHLIPDRLRYVPYLQEPNGGTLWSTSLEGEERDEPAPDLVINIIAVDQTLPQEAVKTALTAAGFGAAAERLLHLGYGLVSTAEGKLSGRRGTAAAGDDVLEEAVRIALERVSEKRSQDLSTEEMQHIAEAVGVGAVRYFMVQYNPLRNIVFDVADVVSYDGNTALYIQYALVRMFAILRRARDEHGITTDSIAGADPTPLDHEQEKRLILSLVQLPELLAAATRTLSVNLIAEYAFDLATIFNQFYRDCGVLNAPPELRAARLLLVQTVRDVLVTVCGILGVPIIERL